MRVSRRHLFFVVTAILAVAAVIVVGYGPIGRTSASGPSEGSSGLVTVLAATDDTTATTLTPTTTTLTETTTTLTTTSTTLTSTPTSPVIPPPATTSSTTTSTTTTPPKPFPGANVSYPNGAIITFGSTAYVFAGGRAFGVASATVLAAVQKVDPAKVLAAPAGASAPSSTTARSGVLIFTKPVNGNDTIYVVGTDGELHGFATPRQFGEDGYNGALVVTVPTLGGLTVGSSAGTTLTALATRADGAIVNSSGTYFTFAGGKAFGIPTPTLLTTIQTANHATVLTGSVTSAETGAAAASGVLLSVSPAVYVTYQDSVYPFKTTTQLANDGYGGTAGIAAPHTGGLPVVFPYVGS
jgi:hypothetical protein